ncbi:MAG: hypothetical protein GY909_15505 [Oligoflexia bacterium]|nr:hypothetical protein [Oligoflexia bacterium]
MREFNVSKFKDNDKAKFYRLISKLSGYVILFSLIYYFTYENKSLITPVFKPMFEFLHLDPKSLNELYNHFSKFFSLALISAFLSEMLKELAMMFNHYKVHLPYLGLVSFCISLIILSIFKKEKKIGDDNEVKNDKDIRDLLEELHLVEVEKTKERMFEIVNNDLKEVFDEHGRPVFKEIKTYPILDFSDLPNTILIKELPRSKTANLSQYLNGLLEGLHSRGIIKTTQGYLRDSGYPGKYTIELSQKDDLKEKALFREISWYYEETINNIKKEYFPKVTIKEEGVYVDFKNINIKEIFVKSGLEKFCNFHKIELKTKFEKDGDLYKFRYKNKLHSLLPQAGQTILSHLKDHDTEVSSYRDKAKNLLILIENEKPWQQNLKDFLEEIRTKFLITDEDYEELLENIESKKTAISYLHRLIERSNIDRRSSDYHNAYFDDRKVYLSLWEKTVIFPMKKHLLEKGSELIFAGELLDSNITYDSQIFFPLKDSPHVLCAGQTRSGKTKSKLSVVFHLWVAYPKAMFLFADAKAQFDLDPFAEKMSDYPVAKTGTEEEPLIELANILKIAMAINKHRSNQFQKLSKEKGVHASTYIEYNKYVDEKDRMPRVFVVLDEFKTYIDLMGGKAEEIIKNKGSLLNQISTLCRLAASSGITFIIGSQRVQATDYPTEIRSNLTTRLTHSVTKEDAKFLGLTGYVEGLSQGRFILEINGVFCRDNPSETKFLCAMPFVGEETQELLEMFSKENKEHKPFNYELIYRTGKKTKMDKLSTNELFKYIKELFVAREGFRIVETLDPSSNYISLLTKVLIEDKEYRFAIGIVSSEEVSDSDFRNKLLKERPHDFHEYYKVFFVTGKVNSGTLHNKEEEISNTCFLSDVDYMRPLKKANSLYDNKELKKDEHVFLNLIKERLKNSIMLDEIADYKFSHDEFNVKVLHDIIDIKNNHEKGDTFEKWYLALERYLGHDTVNAKELIKKGELKQLLSSNRADGGLDLCRWINRETKEACMIQLKNQSSKALSTDVIDKMIKTRDLYKASNGVKFTQMLLVTTGSVTRNAKKEASLCGVGVITYNELVEILEDM